MSVSAFTVFHVKKSGVHSCSCELFCLFHVNSCVGGFFHVNSRVWVSSASRHHMNSCVVASFGTGHHVNSHVVVVSGTGHHMNSYVVVVSGTGHHMNSKTHVSRTRLF